MRAEPISRVAPETEINQSINQSIKQSIDKSINQPTNQSIKVCLTNDDKINLTNGSNGRMAGHMGMDG